MDEFLKISQGLLTPVIGVIASYIAWQQWKTNRDKLNLDRYEKRLQVYKEVVEFICIGIREANYKNDELMSFKPKVSEADFLFGEEISKYIDELHGRAVNLYYWNGEYRDYSHQLNSARKLFKKYLDVSK